MDIQKLMIGNITITSEILKLISEIDEFKGRWTVIENLAPERLSALKKVASIESIGSSTRIEGAQLSDSEVEALLSKLEIKSFATRDEQEVAGYADAMNMVFDSFESISISENHLKQIHGTLLKYSTKDEEHRGKYKTVPNHVEAFNPDGSSAGIVFQTASPFDTPSLMNEVVTWYNQSVAEESQHPLIIIGIFIVVFLAIHPFKDGNGRLSRIITTLLLLRAKYDYVPYSSLESVIEKSKENYYIALRRTQQKIYTDKQEWEHWLVYFLRTMIAHKSNLSSKLENEKNLQASLPALSRQIIEMARSREEITVKDIEEKTKANRSTIKTHLKNLTAANYLELLGKGRGARYKLK